MPTTNGSSPIGSNPAHFYEMVQRQLERDAQDAELRARLERQELINELNNVSNTLPTQEQVLSDEPNPAQQWGLVGSINRPLRFSEASYITEVPNFIPNSGSSWYTESKPKSKKDKSLQNSKIEFLRSLTDENVFKECTLFEGETKYYDILKALSNGVRIFQDMTTDTKPVDLYSDKISFDEFKSRVKVGYMIVSGFKVSSLQGDNIVFEGGGFNCDFTLVGKIPDAYTLQEVNNTPSRPFTLEYNSPERTAYMSNNFRPLIMTVSVPYDNETVFQNSMSISWNGIDSGYTYLKIKECYNSLLRTCNAEINTYERANEVHNRRPNTTVSKYQSPNKKGLYVSHEIPFSCEIECYGKNKKATAEMSRKISRDIGIAHDGSLSSNIGFPIELQTPILKGKRGEILVAETCTTLVDMGFKIDRTCGTHIHLDGGKIFRKAEGRPAELISLYLFYRLFENVIESFLPSTRRNNRYCSKFISGAVHNDNEITIESMDMTFQVMDNIQNLDMFQMYWYKQGNMDGVRKNQNYRYTTSRYFGANFHSLLKDNHFEIRYHSGTLNYEKILYWIDLHGNIMKACQDGVITEQMIKDLYAKNYSLDDLTHHMFGMIKLNDDTREYLLDRQARFKDVKKSEEILIDKTKKVGVA